MKICVKSEKGFSLLEMVAVLTVITILAAIALPNYHRATEKAREAVLKENLFWMRDAIDQYYLDNGKYPQSLDKLKDENYIREVPIDPVTEKKNWRLIFEDYDEYEEPDFEPGIKDVRSRARGRDTKKKLYRSY